MRADESAVVHDRIHDHDAPLLLRHHDGPGSRCGIGSGGGTPLILLHQTPRSVDEFAEVLPLLAKHHQTIAIDNPGYGCSDPVEGQPTVAEYILDAGVFVANEKPALFAQTVLDYLG